MRSAPLLCVFALTFVAACGSKEDTAEPAAVADEVVVIEETPEVTAETAEMADEVPQAVEESGGEAEVVEEQDKPILLAQAETPASTFESDFDEGTHYYRIIPTQPTVGGGDKIEVAEFFWYGCGHCYEFETYITPWSEQLPANVRFVHIPATWNPLVELHAQLYYTEEVLVTNGKIANPAAFRAAVFAEYHRRNNRLTSLKSIEELFVQNGVSAEEFQSTWSSFEVAQKLRIAKDLARRYAITGVPAMVVNGKYRSGKAESGTYPALLDIVDDLVTIESMR